MSPSGSPISFALEFVAVLWREAIKYKSWVALGFAITSLAVLGLGLVTPKKYISNTIVMADQQNIIKPLLEGQAATTKVSDQERTVREVVMSPRLLGDLIRELELAGENPDEYVIDETINQLRRGITVESVGEDFIKIEYAGNDADETYSIVSTIADLFIKNSKETKSKESREAFLFIDKQVKAYKSQLKAAEENLKTFTANNLDGTEESVKARVASLRNEIETIRLNIEENETRIVSLERELAAEGQFLEKRFKSDVYRERLASAMAQLDTLKLTYTDDYPDVVVLTHQIEDMQKAMKEMEESQSTSVSSGSAIDSKLNPLYGELRSKIATEKVELNSKRRRLEHTNVVLEKEYARMKRIADRQAELAELTRDYKVNKQIYEDMLERKEKARLSMTLDVEGQGVTYRIQEPAIYPLIPTGLRFFHFVVLGPIAGFLMPFGVLALYIQVDPRIRFRSQLEHISSVPVLGVVPHIATPLSKRILKSDVVLLGGFLVIVMCVYVAIAFARHGGVI